MKLPGYAVPIPSFASLAITYIELVDWLKVLTLMVGLGTSVVIFMSWLSRRRRESTEERLVQLKLNHEQRLICAECIEGTIGKGECRVPIKFRPVDCPRLNDPEP